MSMYLLPYHSVVTVYFYFIVFLRWSACFYLTYFTPKSSTTNVNFNGRHSCLQIPGTNLLWCSCICWVVFHGVSWLGFLTAESHECHGWQKYIPPHLFLLFIWVFILWIFHLGCIRCVCGCIKVAWVVWWDRSLICLFLWIWLLLWILRCWRGVWQPSNRLWA